MRGTEDSESKLVSALSDKQIDALRQTYFHKSSKEIALLRGVTPSAIDAQIERAMRRLGVSTRIAAAQMVMRHSADPSERLPWQPGTLADQAPDTPQNAMSDQPAAGEGEAVAEMPAVYVPPSELLSGEARHEMWRNPDQLSRWMRIGMIPLLAFLTLAIVFTLLAMGEKASDWANRNLPSYRQSNR